MSPQLIHIFLGHEGREELDLKLWVHLGTIKSSQLSGIGGPELLDLLEIWRPKLVGQLCDLEVPLGSEVGAIFLREAILKACGKWKFPVDSEYLCHCRMVSTTTIDLAIIRGAHTPQEVSDRTSASTGCGTCQVNVEEVISYRLNKS